MGDGQPRGFRAATSTNWRIKDDRPRYEAPPQDRTDRRASTPNPRKRELPPSSTPIGTRLYVGNLLYQVQPAEVLQFFANNGIEIANLNMSLDPISHRNPSYCFADFDSSQAAEQAMQTCNGKEIRGRPVRINVVVPPREGATRWKSRGENWQPGNSGQGNGGPIFDRWSGSIAWRDVEGPTKERRRLRVSDIPRLENHAAMDAAMRSFFRGFAIVAVGPTKMSSDAKVAGCDHYLFVDLVDEREANRAIEALDGLRPPWSKRKLSVRHA